MFRSLGMIVVGALVAVLAGCTSSSHVMVGTARPPISPDQVKIYFEPPPVKYEQIATLDASSGSMFGSDQSKTDEAIAKLKAEAAKVGANGILLQGVEKHQSGSIGIGVGGSSYGGNSATGAGVGGSGGLYNKNARGLAIYVPETPGVAAPQPGS